MNEKNGSGEYQIPPIIHSVWMGNGKKSDVIRRCQKTWETHLGDYTIVEWNEKNFDLEKHPFAKQAYEQKRWAFVSDYVRAWALYKYGGIYLDTDVLVLDSLSQFRKHRAFVGFEREGYPFTATFGAEKGHPFVKRILDMYEGTDFYIDSSNELAANNTISVSQILLSDYDCKPEDSRQTLQDGLEVYPSGILCNPSKQSSTIHIFTGSWLSSRGFGQKLVTSIKSRIKTKRQAGLYARFVTRRDYPVV